MALKAKRPTRRQLAQIKLILSNYLRLPFSEGCIPGAILEGAIAHVYGGRATRTYDFVDVVDSASQVGWQVKSTKSTTPVTWKRAKIRGSAKLIKASKKSARARRELGRALIDFCNAHAVASLKKHHLRKINLARLIAFPDGSLTYYERPLLTPRKPFVFDPERFTWRWAKQRKLGKKEQLASFQGFDRKTKRKWFAWHGQGENQLHFTGEQFWWPKTASRSVARFKIPAEGSRLDLDQFAALLGALSNGRRRAANASSGSRRRRK